MTIWSEWAAFCPAYCIFLGKISRTAAMYRILGCSYLLLIMFLVFRINVPTQGSHSSASISSSVVISCTQPVLYH